MDFAFYLDLLMIVLLVVTIVYAIILNRKARGISPQP